MPPTNNKPSHTNKKAAVPQQQQQQAVASKRPREDEAAQQQQQRNKKAVPPTNNPTTTNTSSASASSSSSLDPQEEAFWRKAVSHYKSILDYGVCEPRTKEDQLNGKSLAIRKLGTSYVNALIASDRKRKAGEERSPVLVRHYAELGIDGDAEEGANGSEEDEESDMDFSDDDMGDALGGDEE